LGVHRALLVKWGKYKHFITKVELER